MELIVVREAPVRAREWRGVDSLDSGAPSWRRMEGFRKVPSAPELIST